MPPSDPEDPFAALDRMLGQSEGTPGAPPASSAPPPPPAGPEPVPEDLVEPAEPETTAAAGEPGAEAQVPASSPEPQGAPGGNGTAPRVNVHRQAGQSRQEARAGQRAVDRAPTVSGRELVGPDALGRVPPHDLDVEVSVIGALLLDNGVGPQVFDLLRPEDFFRESHRIIYRAIAEDVEDGKPMDAVLLRAKLERAGTLALIGGSGTIPELMEKVPTAANALAYAQIVREMADRRANLKMRDELDASSYGPASAQAARARLRETLDALDAVSPSSDAQPLSDITAKSVSWQWAGRIPAGHLSTTEGDPSMGKTTILLDIAARLTSGRPMPDGGTSGPPGSVMFLSTEDGAAEVIRPRAEVAGADLTRIFVMRFTPSMPGDLPRLERAMVEHDIRLLVLDPLSAFYGADVDSWKDADLRRALSPLAALAQRTGAAIVGIRHHTKGGSLNPIMRGGGSIAISAAARTVLMVTADPDNPDVRVLSVAKCNLARLAPSLRYRLSERMVIIDGKPCPTSMVEWLGEDSRTAIDLLAAAGAAKRDAKADAAKPRVLAVINQQPGMKRDEIAEAAGGNRADNAQAVYALDEDGEVLRVGSGKKGDAFRYYPLGATSVPCPVPVPDRVRDMVGQGRGETPSPCPTSGDTKTPRDRVDRVDGRPKAGTGSSAPRPPAPPCGPKAPPVPPNPRGAP